jgi:hypothetical protein
LKFSRFTPILSQFQDGAWFRFYSSDNPTEMGQPIAEQEMWPGRNDVNPAKMRGSYLWIEVYNATAAQRFALESMSVHASHGGAQRLRR